MTGLLLLLLAFLNSTLKERRDLALENLALRQQLAILKRSGKPVRGKKSILCVKTAHIVRVNISVRELLSCSSRCNNNAIFDVVATR